MQRDDFMKLKLKFAQTDVAGKIAIYTETPGSEYSAVQGAAADVSDRKVGGAGSSISEAVSLSRNQDFDLLRQKNKQMSSGGDKHLETPYFPQVGKAPSADSGRETLRFPTLPCKAKGHRIFRCPFCLSA